MAYHMARFHNTHPDINGFIAVMYSCCTIACTTSLSFELRSSIDWIHRYKYMRIGWSHFFIPQSTLECGSRKKVAGWDLNPSIGWFIAMIIVIVPTIFMLYDTDINGLTAIILKMYVNWFTCDPDTDLVLWCSCILMTLLLWYLIMLVYMIQMISMVLLFMHKILIHNTYCMLYDTDIIAMILASSTLQTPMVLFFWC